MARRDSRRLILQAARTEFANSGFGGARVDRIARKAGVNKQLIFYYFTSKAGLYRAALDEAASRITDAPSPGPASSLRHTLAAIFTRLRDQPETVGLLIHGMRDASHLDPAAVQSLGQPWRQIRDSISAGQGVGLVRDDVDPDELATQAVVMLVGFLALEPALAKLQGKVSSEQWPAVVGETFTRILAW